MRGSEHLRRLHHAIATKNINTRTQALERLTRLMAPYDSAILGGAFAGLTLLPENASFQLRLESLIDVAASRAGGGITPTTNKIRSLCTGGLAYDLVAPLEDPDEYPVTEPLFFEGRAYTVFSGQGEELVFGCEQLFAVLEAISDERRDPALKACEDMVRAALSLENRIAERSRINPGVGNKALQGIYVPAVPVAELLKPVVWSRKEIGDLCAQAGAPIDVLGVLVGQFGVETPRPIDQGSQSNYRAVLRCSDDFLIVRPGPLLQEVSRHVMSALNDLGLLPELARRFTDRAQADVRDSLIRSGATELTLDLGTGPFGWIRESAFGIDIDAAMVVTTVGDPLESLSVYPDAPAFPSESEELAIQQRVSELADNVRRGGPYHEIGCLICPTAPPGRRYRWRDFKVDGRDVLFFTPAILEALVQDDPDPLALIRYAKSLTNFRATKELISTNPLDEYALYAQNKDFYIGDKQGVLVTPGSGSPLRQRHLDRWHRQSARLPREPRDVELVSYFEDGIPILAPRHGWGQAARLVRFDAVDIWVLGNDRTLLPERLIGFAEGIANAVAFWVWRVAGVIFAKATVTTPRPTVTIYIELENPNEWRGDHVPPSEPGNEFVTELIPESLEARVTIKPAFQGALARPDNVGEQDLAAELAMTLIALLAPEQRGRERLVEIVEKTAPLGQQKMLVTIEGDTSSLLGPEDGLPAWRKVSDWDLGVIRDQLAAALEAAGHMPAPPGELAEQEALVQFAVDFLARTLAAAVAELSPDGLVEELLRRQEGLTYASANHRLQMPTRIALYDEYSNISGKLPDEIREISQASVAHRFLVEFVAAQPPHGDLLLSLARYDRLLALGAAIVEYGGLGDALHYRFDDAQVAVLPGGRLGLLPGRFAFASRAWSHGIVARTVAQAQEKYGEYWRPETRPTAPPAIWEAAFRAEFGYQMTELGRVLTELAEIASEGEGSVVARPKVELVDDLARRTGLDRSLTERIVESLALAPRPDFLEPPGFHRYDVYPWRFNRPLSLLRRPLVERGPELVWGRRAIRLAVDYLLNQIDSGRLPARSREMRLLKSTLSNASGNSFEEGVAAMVRARGFDVHKRFTKIAGLRLEEDGNDIGDVDVLALDPSTRRVWAIECKAIAIGITPWELSHELSRIHEPDTGILAKHERRAAWLRGHLKGLLEALGYDARGWQVEPIIAVEVDLLATHLRPSSIPIVDLEQLEARVAAAQAKASSDGKGGNSRSRSAEASRSRTSISKPES